MTRGKTPSIVWCDPTHCGVSEGELSVGERIGWVMLGSSSAPGPLVAALAAALIGRPGGGSNAGGAEEIGRSLADLTSRLERAHAGLLRARQDVRRHREEAEIARSEARWLRTLARLGPIPDSTSLLRAGLEAAIEVTDTVAAAIVVQRESSGPLIAARGLPDEEALPELLFPIDRTLRAVTFSYRHYEDASGSEEPPLRGGVAVPIALGADRFGTLAVFWRRPDGAGDLPLERLEDLASDLAPALKIAIEPEGRSSGDSGDHLAGERRLRRALARECARARRYERRLALILFTVESRPESESAHVREVLNATLRDTDRSFHLEDGSSGALLPESGRADASVAFGRLRLALESAGSGSCPVVARAAVLELEPEDDSVSFLARARRDLDLARAAEERRNAAIAPPPGQLTA
jgi:hypothetical protein